MRPPKTDCIFKISIKKYVDIRKKNKLKIDTRNYRNNTKVINVLCALCKKF